MSYNGSGTFQINTSGQPVVAGTVISSTAFNALTADLATGLSTAITKDGQTTTTARIPFASGINSSSATDSTSTATGSIITSGGVGIAKALYVGTNANIAGTLDVTGAVTVTNPVINNIKLGYTTTATAAGTTTLTAASNYQQFFTGTLAQTIVLPVTSTLALGMGYHIENNSTGTLTVQSSGLNTIATIPAGVTTQFTCILITGTTAASWDYDHIGFAAITGTGSAVLATSPTITTPTISSLSSAAATALTLQSAGTTAVTIDTSQNVGIGATSVISKLQVVANQASYVNDLAQLTITGTNTNQRLLIGYNTTDDKAFIQATKVGTAYQDLVLQSGGGNLLVGKTTAAFASIGVTLSNAGSDFTSTGADPVRVNRLEDGNLMRFASNSVVQGTISVSGTTVTYGGGHLARFGQLPDGLKDPTLLKGTVLTNLNEMCVWINKETGIPADNEQCNKVKISDVDGDANVAGVFVSWSYDEQHDTNDLFVAMTGDMIIRIAQGTTVARGDLLMSAGNGTAKPQGDDIVRSKTVAKVTSTHVTCTYSDGSYCVPCVLMAC